jgi:hypothetical protein
MLRSLLVEGLPQPCYVVKLEHILLNRHADCQCFLQSSVPESVSYYIWACGYSFIGTLITSLKVQACNLLMELKERHKVFVSCRVRNG